MHIYIGVLLWFLIECSGLWRYFGCVEFEVLCRLCQEEIVAMHDVTDTELL